MLSFSNRFMQGISSKIVQDKRPKNVKKMKLLSFSNIWVTLKKLSIKKFLTFLKNVLWTFF